MDGVVAYFSGVSPAYLESEIRAIQRGSSSESFVYFMHGTKDWQHELEAPEIDALVQRLGEPPSAAVSFCSRHGPAAIASLGALLCLVRTFPACVVDDDFGALWNPDDLRALAATAPAQGLFALRGWAGPTD